MAVDVLLAVKFMSSASFYGTAEKYNLMILSFPIGILDDVIVRRF